MAGTLLLYLLLSLLPRSPLVVAAPFLSLPLGGGGSSASSPAAAAAAAGSTAAPHDDEAAAASYVVAAVEAATMLVTSNWTIVYPNPPNCWEVRAAETLASEILVATNLTLRVRSESGCLSCGQKGTHTIYVGRTLHLQATGQPHPHLAAEEAMYFVQDGDLFVLGDDTGTPVQRGAKPDVCTSHLGSAPSCVGAMFSYATCRAGTMYAAYRFCHEQLGVRWLWPGADGAVRVPGQTLRLPAQLSVRSAPSIRLRQVRPNPAESTEAEIRTDLPGIYDSEVAERIRFAEHEWYLKMGLGKSEDLPPWGQAFMSWWHQYNHTHPEYFALQPDGERSPPDWPHGPPGSAAWVKMCVSQPGVWRQITRKFEQGVSSGTGNKSLGVSACEDDFDGGYCTCDKCRALDAASRANSTSGRLSDRYAAFWNSVAATMEAAGHTSAWVSGYAYASYTDPPAQTKLKGNILILSVGYGGHYPVLPNETAASRSIWSGWHEAGAKALAMRPNSLWGGSSSAPWVVGRALTEDVVFAGQHGLLATDFDSNVAQYQAWGPTLYMLSRSLWNAATANASELATEFYSGYGAAAPSMRRYFEYWGDWTQMTFTSASVRRRISQLKANPATGSGRFQFLMIPELYTDAVIGPADALLAEAAHKCSQPSAVADACPKVQKAQLYLTYLRTLRTAINCTNNVRRASTASSKAWVKVADATTMVVAGQALRALGKTLAPAMIVNVHYTFAKATERGDLFGIAAARDAPVLEPGGNSSLLMLPTFNWRIKFDPEAVGDNEKWWARGMNRSQWFPTLIGESFQSRFGRTSAGTAWAHAHGGQAYSGVGWLALEVPRIAKHLVYTHLVVASVQASSMVAWIDGVKCGGCTSVATCDKGVQLMAPQANGMVTTFVFRLNASASGGMLRRVFLKTDDDTSRRSVLPTSNWQLDVDVHLDAAVLPTSNFSTRECSATWVPGAGAYLYCDIISANNPRWPDSFLSSIGVFHSADGLHNWTYGGIVVPRGAAGSFDAGSAATPGAAYIDGKVVISYTGENGIGSPCGIAVAISSSGGLGPFVKQTRPVAACGNPAAAEVGWENISDSCCDDSMLAVDPHDTATLHMYHSYKGHNNNAGHTMHWRPCLQLSSDATHCIVHTVSRDGGKSWSAGTAVLHNPPSNLMETMDARILPDRRVVVIVDRENPRGWHDSIGLDLPVWIASNTSSPFVPAIPPTLEQSVQFDKFAGGFGPACGPQVATIADANGTIIALSTAQFDHPDCVCRHAGRHDGVVTLRTAQPTPVQNFMPNTDISGHDIAGGGCQPAVPVNVTAQECAAGCARDSKCAAWTWVRPGTAIHPPLPPGMSYCCYKACGKQSLKDEPGCPAVERDHKCCDSGVLDPATWVPAEPVPIRCSYRHHILPARTALERSKPKMGK